MEKEQEKEEKGTVIRKLIITLDHDEIYGFLKKAWHFVLFGIVVTLFVVGFIHVRRNTKRQAISDCSDYVVYQVSTEDDLEFSISTLELFMNEDGTYSTSDTDIYLFNTSDADVYLYGSKTEEGIVIQAKTSYGISYIHIEENTLKLCAHSSFHVTSIDGISYQVYEKGSSFHMYLTYYKDYGNRSKCTADLLLKEYVF